MLATLDTLEGHPDYYIRQTIQVDMANGPEDAPSALAGVGAADGKGTVAGTGTGTGTGDQAQGPVGVEAYLLPSTHFSAGLLDGARTAHCLGEYSREAHSVYIPPEQRPDSARAEILAAVARDDA